MRVRGAISVWVELCCNPSRLKPPKPELSEDDNALIVYVLGGHPPLIVRKHQLGDGHAFDEGIDWCYADDVDAVIALRATVALA